MKLVIVRHAIAMERDEFQREQTLDLARASGKIAPVSDDYRPLTEVGIEKMKKNARGLARLVKKPELLVTSPLTRAVQTIEICKEVWGVHSEPGAVICEALKPGSDPADFAKWLISRGLDDDATVVITGHEPHLSSLVAWFVSRSSNPIGEMKKGGACLIDFEGAEALGPGKGQLVWLLTPKILRSVR